MGNKLPWPPGAHGTPKAAMNAEREIQSKRENLLLAPRYDVVFLIIGFSLRSMM